MSTAERLTTTICTCLALVSFAANSLLCRLALQNEAIDPISFSAMRILSGAVVLMGILSLRQRKISPGKGNWSAAAALFLYAIPFAVAYTQLSAGSGALILFASVQITMLAAAMKNGERLGLSQGLGYLSALGGLVYLLLPGVEAPAFRPAMWMVLAGASWGVYSILGRKGGDPMQNTTGNFVRVVPFGLAAYVASDFVFSTYDISPTNTGVWLAISSGALASGIGYTIWYTAVKRLSRTGAAVVQLLVPVIAALGGVLFLSERLSDRLLISGVTILGGVALTLTGKK